MSTATTDVPTPPAATTPAVTPSVRSPQSGPALGTTLLGPHSTPSSTVNVAPPSYPGWIHSVAETFHSFGISGPGLSLAGLAMAGFAAMLLPVGVLVASGVGKASLLLAAGCLQLRFVCRARRRAQRRSEAPAFYGGVPDLVADAVVVAAAGCAVFGTVAGPVLGCLCAFLGLLVAHVRLKDGGAMAPAWTDFASAKHRMVALTVTCVVAAILPYGGSSSRSCSCSRRSRASAGPRSGSASRSTRTARRRLGDRTCECYGPVPPCPQSQESCEDPAAASASSARGSTRRSPRGCSRAPSARSRKRASRLTRS